MITIKNNVDKTRAKDLIQTIYKTCKSEPNLSPRPIMEFWKAYGQGRVLIAIHKGEPVGWLMLVPYTDKVQELVAGFVMDSYRSKGVFTKLIHEAVTYSQVSILVTFNKTLERYLNTAVGFSNSSFWEAIKLSRGHFIFRRLNLNRLKAIRAHYQTSKPKYLIFQKHE